MTQKPAKSNQKSARLWKLTLLFTVIFIGLIAYFALKPKKWLTYRLNFEGSKTQALLISYPEDFKPTPINENGVEFLPLPKSDIQIWIEEKVFRKPQSKAISRLISVFAVTDNNQGKDQGRVYVHSRANIHTKFTTRKIVHPLGEGNETLVDFSVDRSNDYLAKTTYIHTKTDQPDEWEEISVHCQSNKKNRIEQIADQILARLKVVKIAESAR